MVTPEQTQFDVCLTAQPNTTFGTSLGDRVLSLFYAVIATGSYQRNNPQAASRRNYLFLSQILVTLWTNLTFKSQIVTWVEFVYRSPFSWLRWLERTWLLLPYSLQRSKRLCFPVEKLPPLWCHRVRHNNINYCPYNYHYNQLNISVHLNKSPWVTHYWSGGKRRGRCGDMLFYNFKHHKVDAGSGYSGCYICYRRHSGW